MNCLNSFLEWFSETFDVEFNKPFHLLSQDRPIGIYILKDDGIYEIDKDTLEINEENTIPSHTLLQVINGNIDVISNWKPKDGEEVEFASELNGNIKLNKGYFYYNDLDSLLKLSFGLVYKSSDDLNKLEEYVKNAEKTFSTLQGELKGE